MKWIRLSRQLWYVPLVHRVLCVLCTLSVMCLFYIGCYVPLHIELMCLGCAYYLQYEVIMCLLFAIWSDKCFFLFKDVITKNKYHSLYFLTYRKQKPSWITYEDLNRIGIQIQTELNWVTSLVVFTCWKIPNYTTKNILMPMPKVYFISVVFTHVWRHHRFHLNIPMSVLDFRRVFINLCIDFIGFIWVHRC